MRVPSPPRRRQLGERRLDRRPASPTHLGLGGDPGRVRNVVIEVDEKQVALAGREQAERFAGHRPSRKPRHRGAETVGAVDDRVLHPALAHRGGESVPPPTHLCVAEPRISLALDRRAMPTPQEVSQLRMAWWGTGHGARSGGRSAGARLAIHHSSIRSQLNAAIVDCRPHQAVHWAVAADQVGEAVQALLALLRGDVDAQADGAVVHGHVR